MKKEVQEIEIQARKINFQFSTKITKIIVFSSKRRKRKLNNKTQSINYRRSTDDEVSGNNFRLKTEV